MPALCIWLRTLNKKEKNLMKKPWYIFALLLILASALAACAPAAAPEAEEPAAEEPAAEEPAAEEPAEEEPAATEPPAEEEAAEPTAVPTPTIPPPVLTEGEGCDPNATRLTWYIGLGAGSNADVIPAEEEWAENYNRTHPEVCLILNIVYNDGGGGNSYNALRALIAAGNAPDIVGPVGKNGRASFQGAWADVRALADAAGFDLSTYDPRLLEFTEDEGVLVGLPFALFPSFLFYNKDLFDEAGLPYPPHTVGEDYMGQPWNLETFQNTAMLLTVDANGNDATSADFDPANIVQFGFFEQWTDSRGVAALFGGGIPYDEATGDAVIPQSYIDAWKWYYDGVWTYHFMPNADYQNSAEFNAGNLFPSGNVAMAHVHTWYTCCFPLAEMSWDIAVMPEINGQITAKLHGDTFAIMRESQNQDLAFQVLADMVVDPELAVIYGGMPAVEEDRAAFFETLNERSAPNEIDWAVAVEMLNYPDLPNHEAWLPNLAEANAALGAFRTLMDQTPDLDLDAAIEDLQADLQTAYDSAP
jgi:multiple sugar transport system substrate-binding protein